MHNMIVIALGQLLLLALLPLGICLVFWGVRKRRLDCVLIGVPLLFIALPALLFCRTFWGLDFLIPGSETRIATNVSGYTISAVQTPGIDFYDSSLEITRPDGKKTSIII